MSNRVARTRARRSTRVLLVTEPRREALANSNIYNESTDHTGAIVRLAVRHPIVVSMAGISPPRVPRTPQLWDCHTLGRGICWRGHPGACRQRLRSERSADREDH